jgi:hypothetical protein
VYLISARVFENHYLCVVSDQTSEAVDATYSYELHARSGLRSTIRLQEDALILPTSSWLAFVTAHLSGHYSEGCISFSR